MTRFETIRTILNSVAKLSAKSEENGEQNVIISPYLFIADLILLEIAETLSQMAERKENG